MAWNEPGGQKDQDPWGTKGGQQGPPDLDEVVRKIQDRLGGLFGRKRGGGAGGTGRSLPMGIGTILLIAAAVWGLSGVYTVDEGYRGLELRFGKYKTTTLAGLHWHFPAPIESVIKVNVERIQHVEIGFRAGPEGQVERRMPKESLMLTQDENIIDIQFAIQYKIKDARDYMFNVINPDLTLAQATESAIREVVGKSKMDFALKEGRSEIALQTKRLVQEILDRYGSGLVVTSVNMQNAQAPEQVQDAFIDAINAEQDQVRLKNEAEAYANDILPKARGQTARMLEEAVAYKEQVVAEAEGEAARFKKLLAQYERAPVVTRERLYLDAIESVMSSASTVMLDVEGGNNLLYLPLDRLLQRTPGPLPPEGAAAARAAQEQQQALDQRARSSLRGREGR